MWLICYLSYHFKCLCKHLSKKQFEVMLLQQYHEFDPLDQVFLLMPNQLLSFIYALTGNTGKQGRSFEDVLCIITREG